MPFATCDHCHAYYVIERKPALQRPCPSCDQPLRRIPREEALARIRKRRFGSGDTAFTGGEQCLPAPLGPG